MALANAPTKGTPSYEKFAFISDEETSASSEPLIHFSTGPGEAEHLASTRLNYSHATIDISSPAISNSDKPNKSEGKINDIDLYEFGLRGTKCCIYEVPQNLRKQNLLAYIPQFVSIGPIHHNKDNLKNIKKLKMTYRESFERRQLNGKASMEEYKGFLVQHEQDIRLSYSKKFDYHTEQFVDMIMLDAVFVMELFLISVVKPDQECELLLPKPWMLFCVKNDLLLLENQLPLFVLEELYNNYVHDFLKGNMQTFQELAYKFFWVKLPPKGLPSVYRESKHFTDMLRYTQRQGDYRKLTPNHLIPDIKMECFHQLKTAIKLDQAGITLEKQIIRQEQKAFLSMIQWVNFFKKEEQEDDDMGVQFKKVKYLLDIFPFLSMIPWVNFFKARFIIPPINVDDTTELLYRNTIALEQCHYPSEPYITNYIAILDRLVDTEEDTLILMDKGIINHIMGSNKEVAGLFNSLLKDVHIDCEFYGGDIKKIHDHCKNPWNVTMATLKSVYFSSLWKGSLTVVGIVVFFFSIVNSIYTFMEYM